MRYIIILLLLCLPLCKVTAQYVYTPLYSFASTSIRSDSIHTNYLKQVHRRPKGTIGTIVGASMLTTGMILNDVAKPGTGLRDVTFLLLIAGYPTTLVSGIILLSHLGDNRRYSVYIGNGKAGFAYNF